MNRRRRQNHSSDPDVVWLTELLRRNPTTEHAQDAVRQLVDKHGSDHVHRVLAIEYERADGSKWRHEAGDRGDGVPRETRPEWLVVDPGEPPRFTGPMVWEDGRGLVG